ncbi:hypothetical protein [Microbulbifer sp. 2205BS26-8]|uniref:hypothetical protein n=1 Tax=Microbulbifer sp. 2205BS26-8 TaxID=3064386 RepID=UPI00273F7E0F|nr:hypothetical protein [Microbulbifer sp. 2205BS26-8]MDP5210021.1 hypothetical protein [Microbulbifer sp. 2205BS26-8]
MKGIEFRSIPITDAEGNPNRPVLSKENVVLQGNILGRITCQRGLDGSLNYHVCLNVNLSSALGAGLAQGHGANRAEAIQNALIKSREAATDYLATLDHLAQQINGSEAA